MFLKQGGIFMDLGMVFKLQGLWMKFNKSHPKFPQFIKAVQNNGMPVDTIIDVKISYPDGKVVDTNMKLTEKQLLTNVRSCPQ